MHDGIEASEADPLHCMRLTHDTMHGMRLGILLLARRAQREIVVELSYMV